MQISENYFVHFIECSIFMNVLWCESEHRIICVLQNLIYSLIVPLGLVQWTITYAFAYIRCTTITLCIIIKYYCSRCNEELICDDVLYTIGRICVYNQTNIMKKLTNRLKHILPTTMKSLSYYVCIWVSLCIYVVTHFHI